MSELGGERDAAALRVVIANSARRFIGEAAHCLALAQGLRARGHQVHLVARRGHELAERARAAGIQAIELTFNSGFHPLKDGADLLAMRRLMAQADVAHCHRGKDHWVAAVAARSLSAAARPALLRTRHVVVPMRPHAANRWLLTHACDGALAVSEAAAASLGVLRPLLAGRLRVVLSAVDSARFTPERRAAGLAWRQQDLGLPQAGAVLVGLVARLQRVKGQEVFIEAARLLAADFPQAYFLIAGRGDDGRKRMLERQVRATGLEGRVLFCGWLNDVPAVVAGLDCGVVASLGSEGSSRITYEYMASGVPVVATRVGGIPEICELGSRPGEPLAELVAPGNAQELAAGIRRVLAEPDAARARAERSLSHVRTHHSEARWLEEIEAAYREALVRKNMAGTGR